MEEGLKGTGTDIAGAERCQIPQRPVQKDAEVVHEKIGSGTSPVALDAEVDTVNFDRKTVLKNIGMNLPSLNPAPLQVQSGNTSGRLRDEEAPVSDTTRLERLGRERPAKFKSVKAEVAFCYSVVASQFMAVSHLHSSYKEPIL